MGVFPGSPFHLKNSQSSIRRIRKFLHLLSVPFVFLMAMGSVALVDQAISNAGGQQPGYGSPPVSQPQPPAGNVSPVKTYPLDEPIRLMTEAARTYQQVKDYTCTMVMQENVKGVLQPEHMVSFQFRVQPFSVYMKWLSPKKMVNQEVCYVHGKNNNNMRVKMPGLVGKLGFINVATNDPRATEHSRHSITEAGIGNVIARCLTSWQQERNFNRSKVNIAEYDYDKKRCYRIEVIALEKSPQSYCYRTVVFLDKQTHLPVRAECYDWPRAGGSPQGELLEVYSYVNIQFNVGLTEQHFNH